MVNLRGLICKGGKGMRKGKMDGKTWGRGEKIPGSFLKPL